LAITLGVPVVTNSRLAVIGASSVYVDADEQMQLTNIVINPTGPPFSNTRSVDLKDALSLHIF
jgi:hypothetical protein